jgi:hypothetical protein
MRSVVARLFSWVWGGRRRLEFATGRGSANIIGALDLEGRSRCSFWSGTLEGDDEPVANVRRARPA